MKAIGIALLCIGTALSLSAETRAERTSPRLMSLGGDNVAGVIPDPYTDLYLSPVHALDFTSTTLWYGRRDTPALWFPSGLPTVNVTLSGGVSGPALGSSNEIALHGARLGCWRIALTTLWASDKVYRDGADSQLNAGYEYMITTNSYFRDSDADAWLVDVAAARPAGNELAWGFRLRASGGYSHLDELMAMSRYYYETSTLADINRYYGYRTARNGVSRRVAFDAQWAVARMQEGLPVEEVAVTISLHGITELEQIYDINRDILYGSDGDPSRYSSIRTLESDSREGDLWGIAAMYRRAYPAGLRLCAGGSFGFISYEAVSGAGSQDYYWNYSLVEDDQLDASLAGDGSTAYGSFFARAGKAYPLHRTLDVHMTLAGSFTLGRSEEDPLVRYEIRESVDTLFATESIVEYFGQEARASLVVPFSIDFHPSSYFSYFVAFSPYARWSRLTERNPALGIFVFEPPPVSKTVPGPSTAELSPGQINDPFALIESRTEDFQTGYSLSCGFSLRYGERFAVDVFTGSNCLPDYWQNLYMNVRCAF